MAKVVKRFCVDKTPTGFDEFTSMFEYRMSAMENKLDLVINTCSSILASCEKLLRFKPKESHNCCANLLLPKISILEEIMRKFEQVDNDSLELGAPVVLVPANKPASDANIQVISLNSEGDCPEGSWLGDENNPEARVRVRIPPSILLHINEHSLTPEKMALTLLDCLFPREVLAISNLSGKGKHCKRQLDPLLIYGIRCHLAHKFNITECDWFRIKQNIDSKCRSVWRKKAKGLPLGASKAGSTNTPVLQPTSEDSSDGSSVCTQDVLNLTQSPVRVVRMKDQTVEIHDGQTIKVFTDDVLKELLPSSVELFSVEDSDCFSLPDQRLIGTDSTEKVDDQLYSSKDNDFLVKLEKKDLS